MKINFEPVKSWFSRNGSTLLSLAGVAGLVTTVVLAVQAVPEAEERRKEAERENEEELTFLEAAVVEAPAYGKTIISGIITASCILGANALSRHQQASAVMAYTALAEYFKEYRAEVDSIFGEGSDYAISKAIDDRHQDEDDGNPPWDTIQTFYIDGLEHQQFFETTMEQVVKAEYWLNRAFITRGHASLKDFTSLLGISDPVDDKIWDLTVAEIFYDFKWIDFSHSYERLDDGMLVCCINISTEPTTYWGDCTSMDEQIRRMRYGK